KVASPASEALKESLDILKTSAEAMLTGHITKQGIEDVAASVTKIMGAAIEVCVDDPEHAGEVAEAFMDLGKVIKAPSAVIAMFDQAHTALDPSAPADQRIEALLRLPFSLKDFAEGGEVILGNIAPKLAHTLGELAEGVAEWQPYLAAADITVQG